MVKVMSRKLDLSYLIASNIQLQGVTGVTIAINDKNDDDDDDNNDDDDDDDNDDASDERVKGAV